MPKLTNKDKMVLYGLVRWPELNDIELSKKIPVKRPTITVIRNKLERDGFYRNIVVPDFELLGCELMTVTYANFNPTASYEKRRKYSPSNKFSDMFFRKSGGFQGIAISASRNYTEIKEGIEHIEHMYSKNDLLSESGIENVFFPLKLSKILRFFNYAPLLKKEFKIKTRENKPKIKLTFREKPKKQLTENEKLVLYALVKYPELNDGRIAKKVSMTRQSVNKIRKKFEKEGLVKEIRIPDVKKLGFEVMLFVHFFIKPKYTMEDRKEGLNYTLSYPGIVFLLTGNTESAVIGFEKTFTSLKREYNKFLSWYKKSGYMQKEPVAIIMPVDDVKEGLDSHYAPLVKKLLGIKKEI